MKLLELVIENIERKDIHLETKFLAQNQYSLVQFSARPSLEGECWSNDNYIVLQLTPCTQVKNLKLADDALTTIITREELMRAYDLVEQGYTLWFGGDCPLEDGVEVEVWLRDYSNTELHLAGNLLWEHYSLAEDIVAYKLVEQSTVKEKLSLSTYYCEDKLQNTILDVWTSQSGDLCVNLTSLDVNNEIVMSPITALQFANDLSALAIKIMEKEND